MNIFIFVVVNFIFLCFIKSSYTQYKRVKEEWLNIKEKVNQKNELLNSFLNVLGSIPTPSSFIEIILVFGLFEFI